jgi:hypothetical protein
MTRRKPPPLLGRMGRRPWVVRSLAALSWVV